MGLAARRPSELEKRISREVFANNQYVPMGPIRFAPFSGLQLLDEAGLEIGLLF